MGHGILSNRTGPPANGVGKTKTKLWTGAARVGPKYVHLTDELTMPIANDTVEAYGRTLYLS